MWRVTLHYQLLKVHGCDNLCYALWPKIYVSISQNLVQEHIPKMLAKITECFMFPIIVTYSFVSIIFELWMSHVIFDTFALVVNFIDDYWVLNHVTIGLFEVPNIFGVVLSEIVKPLLWKFELTKLIHMSNMTIWIWGHLRMH